MLGLLLMVQVVGDVRADKPWYLKFITSWLVVMATASRRLLDGPGTGFGERASTRARRSSACCRRNDRWGQTAV